MYRNFKYQWLVVISVFSLVSGAFGQGETTAVERSALIGVRLPSGAQRVNDEHVPVEISQLLEDLVAQSGGKLRRGDTEVLLWTGSDLKKGARPVVDSLIDTVASNGWQHQVGGTADGVTVFSLLKSGTDRRAVIGIHGELNGTLIFAFTELHAESGAQSSPNNTSIKTESGTASGYSFTTPEGWSQSDSAGKITLSKDGDKSLVFLPPTDSSGNLERDADRILWQVFKNYGPWSGNGFGPDYGTFERGRTVQGLEYFRAYRYGVRNGDDSMFGESRFDAIILLVKIGSKAAVIVGRQPFQSDYARDSVLSAVDLILYDLKLQGAGNTYDHKTDFLGSWSAAGGSVGLAYTFHPNGSFTKGAASQFRTSHDAYRDKVTTTSYGMTESYSLSGNILTQNYKRTGEVVKYKIRLYETRYDKDPWQRKLGFLPVVDPDRGTIVFQRSN